MSPEPSQILRPLTQAGQLRDRERAGRNLTLITAALRPDGTAQLLPPLARFLPRCADADMALNNLERFFASPAGVRQLPALLDGRARTLEILLQLFSTSYFFSDLLALNPDFLDMLRVPLRHSPS